MLKINQFEVKHVMVAVLMAAWMSMGGVVMAVPMTPLTETLEGHKPYSNAPESKWIEALKSGTNPQKAIACKELAVRGTKNAVPALAALLTDKEMASWARIALEAIPGPEAVDALRDAMGKLNGRLLVGVINSLAVRRDVKSIDGLTLKIKDSDQEVASAAAAALGRIGGEQAATILEQAIAAASAGVKPTVAEGCILCADGFLAAGNSQSAVHLYDLVRNADIPAQWRLEGTRGAILARNAEGIPLLVEQLKSPDKGAFNMGLRVARELKGPEVREALVAELGKATPQRQALLVRVLADRAEPQSLQVILALAKSAAPTVRVAAVESLEALGDVSCIPTLLEAAVDANAELSQSARKVLARLQGNDVEAELLAQLQKSTGKTRQTLIELAADRKIDGSFPIIQRYAQDPDAGVRAAAIETIGVMGDEKQIPDLANLLKKSPDAKDRSAIEKSLGVLAGRCGAACVPALLELVRSSDASVRPIGLHGLAGAGGKEALTAVKAALTDNDPIVQDEAVRTLSTWPNRWPDDADIVDPLFLVAKSPAKPAHKILAIRGIMQYVQGAKKLKDAEKIARIKDVLPLMDRAEEKRLAISALGDMKSGAAIHQLVLLTADKDVSEEASVAIINHKSLKMLPKPQRANALQAVLQHSKVESTRKRAQEAL